MTINRHRSERGRHRIFQSSRQPGFPFEPLTRVAALAGESGDAAPNCFHDQRLRQLVTDTFARSSEQNSRETRAEDGDTAERRGTSEQVDTVVNGSERSAPIGHEGKSGRAGAAKAEVDFAVATWGLGKRYGTFDALTDCSLRVARGEVFGLLGPNGAGKTTLIRLLLGFLRPTSGRSEVDGVDPTADGVAVRRRVSYLPGDARLPRHMSGRGVLRFFSDLHPEGDSERCHEVADRLELDLRRRVGFMSTGMRQKLALAVVFGPRTPVLILDEPTANLDPTVRGEVLSLVGEAQSEGRTVVLSSHVLSEIEQTCGRVAFLRRGRLAHELRMSDLFQRHRVTGIVGSAGVDVPPELADRITVGEVPPRRRPEDWPDDGDVNVREIEGGTPVQIDTAGDLAPLFPWLDSLGLRRVRIEPLGLRAVYDAVHFGERVTV